jgi:hypothetical protein
MADAGKSDWQTALLPAADSLLDMIRVAFYAHQVSEAVDMIRHSAELGYDTTANGPLGVQGDAAAPARSSIWPTAPGPPSPRPSVSAWCRACRWRRTRSSPWSSYRSVTSTVSAASVT